MSINKKATIVSAVLVSSALLSGCGLFGGEDKKEKIDPPQTVSYEEEDVVTEESAELENKGKEEAEETTAKTDVYLIDSSGYVVSQTLELPKTNSVAKQALEYLVVDGPVTNMLPNDFRAVLPAGTKVSVNIKDNVANVDFSKEFSEYKAEDEMRILQAVTWTLTQFDSVEKVKMTLNGNEMKEMPVEGTPIGETSSRASGINIDTSMVTDITNTKPVTVYYLGGEQDSYYYVPVTKRVSNKLQDNVEAVVKELAKGPGMGSKLSSLLQKDAALIGKPEMKDGVVTLDFNESVYSSFEEKIVSENLIKALALSLTEQEGIEGVAVTVNGEADLVNEDGEKIEAVTRPENVNTGIY
ncbi:GerMN domain-containing protein [Cytobacillus purgationiresistens]|uniref:Germination protein M n=1 Tax=Cytobacillus purgationiresistens TaxID=863449 RepID=A0ABU0AHW8_9BACI|nr:GerMN domain-containing protein [Cytobacillus purgationiresistens]MDQ0270033.1 germination protein M [Cytobacillus purgationiresistens]